ncbi:MAG: hypothetical protein ACMG55_11330, partial [Microcoleus sp.]
MLKVIIRYSQFICIAILAMLLFLSLFVQPNGDDFCFIAATNDRTIDTMVTASGRWSVALFSNSIYRLGSFSLIIIPLLGFVFLTISSYFLIHKILDHYDVSNKIKSMSGFLSVAFCISLVLSLHYFYQSIYWSGAVIAYVFPISAFNILLLLILGSHNKLRGFGILALSLFILLFNPAFVVLVAASAVLMIGRGILKKSRYLVFLGFGMVALCAAALLIYKYSPAAVVRFDSYQHPHSLLGLGRTSILAYLWYVNNLLVSFQSL